MLSRHRSILLAMVLLSLTMWGGTGWCQSYDVLWKQYEQANAKDQPKTALTALRKIEGKAQKDRKYGHFLAASMCDISMSRDISSDSADVAVARIRQWERSVRSSAKDAKQALAAITCRVLLSKYYCARPHPLTTDNEKESWQGYTDADIRQMLDSLMADGALLAVATEADATLAYTPIVKREADSRYFNYDMLSLLCFETQRYDLLERHYAAKGNRRAACIAASKMARSVEQADSLIAIYGDLGECGALALAKARLMEASWQVTVAERVEWLDTAYVRWPQWRESEQLQNMRMALTCPRLNVCLSSEQDTPTHEQTVYFHGVRNVSEVSITVTPLRCEGTADIDTPNNSRCYARIKPLMDTQKRKTFKHYFDLYESPKPYELRNDSICIGAFPVGVYLVEITPKPSVLAHFVKEMKPQRCILRVSDLQVMAIGLPQKRARAVVVNATTGQPVAGAKLSVRLNRNATPATYTTDYKGECILENHQYGSMFCATTATDKASAYRDISTYFYNPKANGDYGAEEHVRVFTDRALYRPGQTLEVSAVCYLLSDGTKTAVMPGKKLEMKLVNAKYETVATDTLETDEYGTVHTTFRLPENGRNGQYRVFCGSGSVSVSVEEYVRPTFEVAISKPETIYSIGDTLTVQGKATAYSGAGMADAKVAYTIRRASPWWRTGANDNEVLLQDTVWTAADGTFTLRMPMVMPAEEDGVMPLSRWYGARFYRITGEAVVTSTTGETHSAMVSVPLSDRPTALVSDMKAQYRGDEDITLTISRYNATEKQIEGRVDVMVDDVPRLTVDANKAFCLPADIASGRHTLTAICEGDTLQGAFVVFRLTDEKPAFRTSDWFYASAGAFPEDGGDVAVQIGSSDEDVHVVYAIASGNNIIESGTERLSASNLTRKFAYKPEYGDGITLAYAWTKDGKTYTHTAEIKRPLPSNQLSVEWKTFRDHLTPGQKEEWQMRVTDKDGKAVKGAVVATMFDASLDAIRKHTWQITDVRRLSLSGMEWRFPHFFRNDLYINASYDSHHIKELQFSGFAPDYLPSYGWRRGRYGFKTYSYSRAVGEAVDVEEMAAPMMLSMKMKETNVAAAVDEMVAETAEMDGYAFERADMDNDASAKAGEGLAAGRQQETAFRKDFSETAFFLPTLRTDADGVATLAFTLPESVTTWRIMALAHDKEIRYGMLTDEVVAQKQLMIQPKMPRFLRVGDKATLAATITNLSEEQKAVTAIMTLHDAKTEKQLLHICNKVIVNAGESQSVVFPLERYPESDFICRVTAECDGFSDGEQHIVPVLSDKELVTRTASYVFIDSVPASIELAELMEEARESNVDASVKVEYTAHPEWLLLDALPSVAIPDCDNAIRLSSALYANVVAAAIKDTVPYFDPQKIIGKLLLLQRNDGSFSWWQGMEGSPYMTQAVAETLVRMEMLAGRQRGVEAMLRKAMAYLHRETAKDVKEMKKETAKGHTPWVSKSHLEYLYTAATYNKVYSRDASSATQFTPAKQFTPATQLTPSSDQKYLLDLMPKSMLKADMQTKAMAAVVFHLFGRGKEAREYAESIVQHTVCRTDLGRYFDSDRATYSWCDYRIPTQTMAIEALKAVTPQNRQEIADMKRWLLNSKRTQQWDNPYNTVNAVHAFFTPSLPLPEGLGKATLCDSIVSFSDTIVSICTTPSHNDHSFIVALPEKPATTANPDGTETWAAAFVSYMQKSAEVKQQATGLSVRRELLCQDTPKVGDKVTVRITIEADHDYDFVTVTDNRAACLEPVNQLSDYRDGCYQEIKDKASAFHFNKFRKGKHTIETEYFVERAGTYGSGTVTVECAYAPEFRGTGKSYTLAVAE